MRIDLREQQPRLGLAALDHVLTGDPAQRGLVGARQLTSAWASLAGSPACAPFIEAQKALISARASS